MSHTPDPHDAAQPELLEQAGGRPLDRERPGRRRKVLVPVLAGLGLAAVGGAAFGAWWFLDEGAQAAEALPSTAVGYVGLTLDPSGSQKLEALRTLEKFPLIAEELGLDGDLGEIDLREKLADVLIAESGCEELSYDDDFEPSATVVIPDRNPNQRPSDIQLGSVRSEFVFGPFPQYSGARNSPCIMALLANNRG